MRAKYRGNHSCWWVLIRVRLDWVFFGCLLKRIVAFSFALDFSSETKKKKSFHLRVELEQRAQMRVRQLIVGGPARVQARQTRQHLVLDLEFHWMIHSKKEHRKLNQEKQVFRS